jgi:hypothetical protein
MGLAQEELFVERPRLSAYTNLHGSWEVWNFIGNAKIKKKGTSLSRSAFFFTKFFGVADGARTHDNWNHNPGLYQLSYSHLWVLLQ